MSEEPNAQYALAKILVIWAAAAVPMALLSWVVISNCVSGVLYASPARRFRSTWMAVILHSAQSVFFIFLILGIVLGLA